MFRAAFLLLALSSAASAGLQWENPLQEFQRVPEDKFVEARFAFKNTGAQPVTIVRIRTSCGCTTATLDKKNYAPGESGEIITKFTFFNRIGPQRKVITVISDDGERSTSVLDLRVWVNQPLTVKPALVFWKVGDPAAAKTVQLTAEGRKVGIKSVTSSSRNLKATLQTVKAGESWVVEISPIGTAQRESAELLVHTDFPPDAPRTYKIHARIK